jgi:hypothetical protein
MARTKRGLAFERVIRVLAEGRAIRRMAWPPRVCLRHHDDDIYIEIGALPRQVWRPHGSDILARDSNGQLVITSDWEVVE